LPTVYPQTREVYRSAGHDNNIPPVEGRWLGDSGSRADYILFRNSKGVEGLGSGVIVMLVK